MKILTAVALLHCFVLVSPVGLRAGEAEAVARAGKQVAEKGVFFGRESVVRKGGSVAGVSLAGTPVTGAGLRELFRFKKLQYLHLGGPPVTDAGVSAFEKALPDCRITR